MYNEVCLGGQTLSPVLIRFGNGAVRPVSSIFHFPNVREDRMQLRLVRELLLGQALAGP
jgi:hypothetical protein